MTILSCFSVFIGAVTLVSIPDSLGFRHMHPAMRANDHVSHRGFIGRWFLARSQGALDDCQDQP